MAKKYSLKQDHKSIKEQIKEWEILTDFAINCLSELSPDTVIGKNGTDESITVKDIVEDLENMSHEMCSINL